MADAPIKVRRCSGDGQGSCKRCADNGQWNRHWMAFLYEIDGRPGCYCWGCVKKIQEEVSDDGEA